MSHADTVRLIETVRLAVLNRLRLFSIPGGLADHGSTRRLHRASFSLLLAGLE